MQSACTHCFSGLGVEARMAIYQHLKEHQKATVSELVGLVDLTQPTVSYHLKEMKKHGLLTSTKKGKEVFYSINTSCPIYHKDCVLSSVEFSHA